MGEGWHNNHHHYQASARQGFCWWEWDPSFYVLWLLSKVGVVRDLKVPSEAIKRTGLLRDADVDHGLELAAVRRGRQPAGRLAA